MAQIYTEDGICEDNAEVKSPFWSFRSLRFYIAFLLMAVVLCTNFMRDNLSMAMLCMVNTNTAGNHSDFPHSEFNSTRTPIKSSLIEEIELLTPSEAKKKLDWTPLMQGILFSAPSYGSITTGFFAGYFSDRYGCKKIIVYALLAYSILNLISPILIQINYYVYLVARIVMGLAEGCVPPPMAALSSKWFLNVERSTVEAIYTSGYQIGNGASMIVGAYICSRSFLGGWPLIFYISGAIGLICLIIWCITISDRPSESKIISKNELTYLKMHLVHETHHKPENLEKFSVPWLKIVTSPAVIAVITSDIFLSCQMLFMQQFLPTYIKDVVKLDIKTNGLFSAVPFVSLLISKIFLTTVANHLRNKSVLSLTTSCKILQCFAAFGTSCVLIILALLDNSTKPLMTYILLMLFGACFAGHVPGSFTASICIAPPFTGIINPVGSSIAKIVTPVLIGFIVKDGVRSQWTLVFIIIALLNICTGVFFACYGSAEVQQWAKPKVVEKKMRENENATQIQENSN